MNAEEFRRKTGVEPAEDDLERVNCSEAGALGHWYCGWCDAHEKPRFFCCCAPSSPKTGSNQAMTNKPKRIKWTAGTDGGGQTTVGRFELYVTHLGYLPDRLGNWSWTVQVDDKSYGSGLAKTCEEAREAAEAHALELVADEEAEAEEKAKKQAEEAKLAATPYVPQDISTLSDFRERYTTKMPWFAKSKNETKWRAHSEDQRRLSEEFKADALFTVGLDKHPRRDRIFAKAYDHSCGFYEVFSYLQDLAELFEDDEVAR